MIQQWNTLNMNSIISYWVICYTKCNLNSSLYIHTYIHTYIYIYINSYFIHYFKQQKLEFIQMVDNMTIDI